MNDEPLVSVIIPTYKRPDKIIEAIKTVKKQTYSNFEIIIVDDNDPESDYRKKTRAKVESYNNDELVYIENEKNMGACAARNTGIDYAKGEYIAFLDDDDKWEKTKIEKQVKLIEKNHKLGLVFCDFKYLSDSKKTDFQFNEKMFIELLKRGSGISTSTFLAKKLVLNAIEGFDIDLPSNQDYDLLLRVSKKYNIDYVPEVLMLYDDGSEGITQNSKNKLEGREKIIYKYQKYYYENNIVEYLTKQYDKAAHFSIMNNDKNKAIDYLDKSLNIKDNKKNRIKKRIIMFGGKALYSLFLKIYLKVNLLLRRS